MPWFDLRFESQVPSLLRKTLKFENYFCMFAGEASQKQCFLVSLCVWLCQYERKKVKHLKALIKLDF